MTETDLDAGERMSLVGAQLVQAKNKQNAPRRKVNRRSYKAIFPVC